MSKNKKSWKEGSPMILISNDNKIMFWIYIT